MEVSEIVVEKSARCGAFCPLPLRRGHSRSYFDILTISSTLEAKNKTQNSDKAEPPLQKPGISSVV